MAKRPWVQPDEVLAYTDIDAVKARPLAKLNVDIFRAEQRVISLTNNTFDQIDDGKERYPEIPQPVKTAVILLAEAYAKRVADVSKAKTLKSETFDDYSYTAADTAVINEADLGLDDLLGAFTIDNSGSVSFRLRKL